MDRRFSEALPRAYIESEKGAHLHTLKLIWNRRVSGSGHSQDGLALVETPRCRCLALSRTGSGRHLPEVPRKNRMGQGGEARYKFSPLLDLFAFFFSFLILPSPAPVHFPPHRPLSSHSQHLRLRVLIYWIDVHHSLQLRPSTLEPSYTPWVSSS